MKPSSQTKWNLAHPLELWAHNAVRSALRRGIIERKPCEVCGTAEQVDAHHDDYHRPLKVRWLCRQHHQQHHRDQRNGAGT